MLESKATEPDRTPRATHVAVDPGIEGAIAWRDETGARHVRDLPVRVVELKAKTRAGKPKQRTDVDARALLDLIRDEVRPAPGCRAAIEALNVYNASKGARAGGRQTNATSPHSAAKQGANYGRAEACLHTAGPVEQVTSQRWRKHHEIRGASKKERKAQAVDLACALLPDLAAQVRVPPVGRQRKTQVKDGRADALLLLLYLETTKAP